MKQKSLGDKIQHLLNLSFLRKSKPKTTNYTITAKCIDRHINPSNPNLRYECTLQLHYIDAITKKQKNLIGYGITWDEYCMLCKSEHWEIDISSGSVEWLRFKDEIHPDVIAHLKTKVA